MKISSRRASRSLQFEPLESRRVMAVTASLSGGVLTVTGTDGADDIQFLQGNGLIGVVGIYAAWNAAQVNAIRVDLKGGNDYVSLDSVGFGWQPMSEDFTITSGAGTETVKLADGRTVTMNGAGHTLNVAPDGYAKLNGSPIAANTLTANLSNGVLRVTGTNGNDSVQFLQGNGLIGVVGIYAAWNAAQVTSIVVDLFDGNDYVSLDSVGFGWQAMSENFTINSGAGTETVRLANGQQVTMNGAGHTLQAPASGLAKLDGVVVPPTVVTAVQEGGVLRVYGTNGNDDIQFIAGNGLIGIIGIFNAWTAASVTSIVVDLYGGNDNVSLDSVGFGWQPLGENFTINSGSGTETVELANGQLVTLNGAGHTLQAPAVGLALLDGVVVPPTVVTAQQVGGVLYVYGTNGDDNIQFLQGGNLIGIVGIFSAWNAASVTSIVVNLYGGNDRVSLDSVGFGWQAMAEAFTINSGNGNETVRLANGHEVTFNGPGHVLQVATNGSAQLDGAPVVPPAVNWFDANIIDAALRSLGSSRYADGVINRTDMIDLLRNAQDGGVVDATELADLRAIVANTSLFTSVDYVRKLASYVVSANVANAMYQGVALGNLAAGSTGAHLENLVGKWFLGLDRPTAGGTYRQFTGQLFVSGPAYTDIRQGQVGDCYLMASLAEVALKNPAQIQSMFIVNGDGTYTVRLFNAGVAEYVTVDSYLPTNGSGYAIYAGQGTHYTNTGAEIWASLAEKAYVQANQFGWIRPGMSGSGQNNYSSISGGYIYAALGHVTGSATTAFAMTSSGGSFTTFVNAYNAGKSIAFASPANPSSSSVVGSHAYAVVGYNATNQTITLYNPWGPEYGLLTMTWSEIQANFSYFDRTA